MSNKTKPKTTKPKAKTKAKAKAPAIKQQVNKKARGRAEREASQDLKKMTDWLRQRQGFIAVLVLMAILGAIIILLSSIFNHANDTSGDLELDTDIYFDQKTIEQIIELDKVDGQIPVVDDSSGRINPFSDQ
ncbi:MAG: hypothetical protein ACOX0Z_00625 [Candidatus Nanosyncoccaceae bacterium]|jgi:hypothetical protein